MNTDRLLRLADLLEKDAGNPTGIKFDMRTWGKVRDWSAPLSCNTVACAAGLACLSGIFKAEGLTVDSEEFDCIEPQFENYLGFTALKKFFDISMATCRYLFEPEWYSPSTSQGAKGELEVARRVRDIVANGERSQYYYPTIR